MKITFLTAAELIFLGKESQTKTDGFCELVGNLSAKTKSRLYLEANRGDQSLMPVCGLWDVTFDRVNIRVTLLLLLAAENGEL